MYSYKYTIVNGTKTKCATYQIKNVMQSIHLYVKVCGNIIVNICGIVKVNTEVLNVRNTEENARKYYFVLVMVLCVMLS